jgi:acyl-CoA synthetase (AMP-forming)/AMP-acid ligase II
LRGTASSSTRIGALRLAQKRVDLINSDAALPAGPAFRLRPILSTDPTVHAAFQRVAARRGDADLLVVETITAGSYGIERGARSWREVDGEVERLRGLYGQAGYGPGHRVGILLENRPAFFTHWLALNALGVSIVPIHSDLRAAELTFLVGHSEMALAVVLPNREGMLRAAATEANVHVETIRPEVAGRIPAARTAPPHAGQPLGRNSECALLYTSGRPDGRRAAASRTATSCAPASGTSASAGSPRSAPTRSASSRRCRSAT